MVPRRPVRLKPHATTQAGAINPVARTAIITYLNYMVTAERTGLFAVLHASSVLESSVDARLNEIGLSLAKLAALGRLAEAGGSLPLGQLADRLSCVKSNVTQLVDRLEGDGLVSRAADTADRRSCLAVLTDAGSRAHVRGAETLAVAERELFGALTRDEGDQLHALLAKIAAQKTPHPPQG